MRFQSRCLVILQRRYSFSREMSIFRADLTTCRPIGSGVDPSLVDGFDGFRSVGSGIGRYGNVCLVVSERVHRFLRIRCR